MFYIDYIIDYVWLVVINKRGFKNLKYKKNGFGEKF